MQELSRLELLIGSKKLGKIKNKTVLILGLGGVGGYVVEALARSGVGNLIIVDQDIIDISNINRQIIALHSNIGKSKVEAWQERIKDIMPSCNVTVINDRITVDNIDLIFEGKVDFAIDACDTVTTKLAFIKYCLEHNIDFVTCLGTGKRMDPTKIEITDLKKTENDPLAKVLRKLTRDNFITGKIPVVYSRELPQKIEGEVIASSIFVPSCAGITAAYYALERLIEGD